MQIVSSAVRTSTITERYFSRELWRTSNGVTLRLILLSLIAVNVGVAQTSINTQNPRHDASRRIGVKKRLAPMVTDEIRLVDGTGKTRLLLSTKSGLPVVQWLRENGTIGLSASLDASGHGSFNLQNPVASGPGAVLEIDDKGAHIKFDHPSGASAYLFLNNAGGSGVVLIDDRGERRLSMAVQANGSSTIERLDEQGKPLP